MRRLLLLSVVAALAVLFVVPAGTVLADTSTGGLRITAIDTSEHPRTTVTVSAPREKVGRDLPAEAFELTERGEIRDVEIRELPAEERQVVLAIDTSGSMGAAPMEAAKEAATAFVRQLPSGARAAVVEFNNKPRLLSPMSSDTEGHAAAISRLSSGGGTALYDSIALSLDQFEGEHGHAIVVLSDGADTKSSTGLDGIADHVADSGASLYVVELQTPKGNNAILHRLALAGSGRVVSAADPDELTRLYDNIAAELRDNYMLTYRSHEVGRVEVRVTVDHPGGQAEVTRRVSLPSPPLVPFAPGVMASPWTLGVGATFMFAAAALLLATVLWPGEVRSLLARRRAWGMGASHSLPGMTTLANRATLVVERNLQKRGWTPSLNASLERAGITLRPGEFVVLCGSAAVAGLAIGIVLGGMLLGLLVVAAVGVLSLFGLRVLGERRRSKFGDQLGESLQLMSGSLRAGYSLLQAVDAVAHEADSPTAEEYRRIVVETRLGRDLQEALHAMDKRVGTEDFRWVVQAIAIHQEVGGDLAEVLDTVAGTLRERNQIRRQVKALSAEGKLSALILFVLPFGIAAFLAVVNPGYLSPLFEHWAGWAMIGMGTVLLTVGGLWLRKVVRIVF